MTSRSARILPLLLLAVFPEMAPMPRGASDVGFSPASADTIVRVNCGGDGLVDLFGHEYLPDRPWADSLGYGYLQGGAWDTWHVIGGAPDPSVYLTARNNYGAYRFLLPPGDYAVTLRMSDYWSHGPGSYLQDIYVQGDLMLRRLDIFQRVERDYALGYRFLGTVTDSILEVRAINYPRSQICAIEVASADSDTVAPSTPVLKEIYGSFGCVVIDWYDNPEEDLAGYDVFRTPQGGGQRVQLNGELNLVSRFLDFTASPDTTYTYEIEAVDLFGNRSAPLGDLVASPLRHEETGVTFIQALVDSADLALMNAFPDSDLYVPATIVVNDTVYENCQIRYRGNVIRKLLKKSYKVKFPSYHLFRGYARKINLTAEFPDPTLMREHLAYDLFREMGVPACDTEPVHLAINDFSAGLYLMVEHVDERFLEHHGLEDSTVVYKCFDRLVTLPDTASYREKYTKETFEDDENWGDLIELVEMLNLTPAEEFYDSLIRRFDVENLMDYYATQIALGGFDFIYKNYFLAHNLVTDTWQIWPWDLDLTFGVQALWDTLGTPYSSPLKGSTFLGNVLFHRAMEVPVLKNLHFCNLLAMTRGVFADSVMTLRIQDYYQRVAWDGERDWRKWGWEDNRWFREGPQKLTAFVQERNAYFRSVLPSLMEEQTLFINEVMPANTTFFPDEYGEYDDWIELYNGSPDTVRLLGYYLTDDLRVPLAWALPDTFIPPWGHLIVWADGDTWQGPLHASFKLNRNGERVALHYAGAAVQAVDLFPFGPIGDDLSWAREFDGGCPVILEADPTPGEPNAPISGVPDVALGSPSLHLGPNPGRRSFRIGLDLPRGGRADVAIYDVRGRRLRTLFSGDLSPGLHTWRWRSRDEEGRLVPAGVYWVRAWTPAGTAVRRLVRIP
jgi:spore coat protein H